MKAALIIQQVICAFVFLIMFENKVIACTALIVFNICWATGIILDKLNDIKKE